MDSVKKLNIEVKADDGSRFWVNPGHIIKVVQTNQFKFMVHLTNGDVFEVSYSDANKIREYFETV